MSTFVTDSNFLHRSSIKLLNSNEPFRLSSWLTSASPAQVLQQPHFEQPDDPTPQPQGLKIKKKTLR